MKLLINGEEKQVKAQRIDELLAELGLDAQPVAVEVNRTVVPKRVHDQTTLSEGDRIELVTLVGGG